MPLHENKGILPCDKTAFKRFLSAHTTKLECKMQRRQAGRLVLAEP